MKKPPLYVTLLIAFVPIAAIAVFIIVIALNALPVADEPQINEMYPDNTDIASPHSLPQDQPQDPQEGTVWDPAPEESLIDYQQQGGVFELPVAGATGWAARTLPLYEQPQASSGTVSTLVAGQGFVILEEQGDWWNVQLDTDTVGWVEHSGCFINLPDIIPSIVYNISNAQSSLKRSTGLEIPNITGQVLYDAWTFNQRLDRHEFVSPVLYATSEKIALLQKAALSNGDTVVMYEAFRPRETQQKVVSNLSYLMSTNEDVNSAINTPPWSISSFIATSLSNHQRGAAIDVSLGRVISQENRSTGGYAYIHITESEEYAMPSPMHELSPLAASSRITELSGAARLRGYCVDEAGFDPMSSEWWHFNDPDGIQIASQNGVNGAFYVYSIHSIAPNAAFDPNSIIVFSSGLPDVEDPPPLPEEPDELTVEELEELEEQFIEALMSDMSLAEQVMQLFIIGPETEAVEPPYVPSDGLWSLPYLPAAGGYVVYADGNVDTARTKALLESQIEHSGISPFVYITDGVGSISHNLIGLSVSYAMNTEEITSRYSSAEVAVMVLQAGGDIILLPQSSVEAFHGIVQAVENGTIPLERITESVYRILKVKLAAGLIYHELGES